MISVEKNSKKKVAEIEILRIFRKHFSHFSEFLEKLMAGIGLSGIFLHIYPFIIFFQAFFNDFHAFSQKTPTLVESRPISLIGHNSGCFRPRGLRISGFSYLGVIERWGKFEADSTTRPFNHCFFGSERLIIFKELIKIKNFFVN